MNPKHKSNTTPYNGIDSTCNVCILHTHRSRGLQVGISADQLTLAVSLAAALSSRRVPSHSEHKINARKLRNRTMTNATLNLTLT